MTRYAVRGARCAAAALTFACGQAPPPEWHDGPGYRWRELHVPRRGQAGFTALAPRRTGITFANTVTEEQVLDNEHVLNGSGVTIGDVDGDGLPDIYFARMDGPNALYHNLGDWRFADITERAGVAAAGRYSTGAVFADVDGDGDLDLIVTSLGGPNSLFLNDGTGVFTEYSDEVGLASGLGSTTMTLADVDGDGDLDLYLANYKLRTVRDLYPPEARAFDRVVRQVGDRYEIAPEFREHYGVFVQRDRIMRFEHGEPDRLYLNDGTGRFEQVPFTDWFRDEHGQPLSEPPRDWGLAARFYDVDGDGHPDLYVCNDFESPDRLWINDGTGRFRTAVPVALRTTSQSSMAVDFADIERDGDVDFLVLDMLDRSTRRQRTQTPPVAPDQPALGEIGARPQQPRNTLFLNRGDGTFAETAYFSGAAASGWSWAVTFLDVDLDGYEDALIATGHAYDFLDSDTQIRIQGMRLGADWRRSRLLFPPLSLQNVALRNNGDGTFADVSDAWGFGREADVSHGLATGDLDGDGDLDVVINRLGAPALVLRNETARPRLTIRLKGLPPNTQGAGAKIHVLGGPVHEQVKEVTLGGMYLSSSEPLYSFATGVADSPVIEVRWRSGARSVIADARPNRLYEVYEERAETGETGETAGAAAARSGAPAPSGPFFNDLSAQLNHHHHEAPYDDFPRQPLLLNALSQLGPGVTWYDVDRDGDEDLLIGAGRGGRLAYYRNDRGRLTPVPLAIPDAALDLTTILAVPDDAGGTALLVGQMNYEAESPQAALDAAPVLRLTLRATGRTGRLAPRLSTAVPGVMSSTGPLAVADYDGDGDLDLFVGGRVLPARYPMPASSRLFRNGAGQFVLDPEASRLLDEVGLVSAALFSDVDGDGDPDLLLALEWGPIRLLINDGGRLRDATESWGLGGHTSRWNGLAAGDFDGDGRLDLIATSWGLNTRHRPSAEHPLVAYFGDFDRSGTLDVIEAQYDPRLNGLAPLTSLQRLAGGIPALRRRVPNFAAYADATVTDLLGALDGTPMVAATTFAHMLFLNRGGRFEAVPLPAEAQLAPAFAALVADFDGDGHEDVFLSQNFFPTELETPRYAEGRGLWLKGDGTGGLTPVPGSVSGIMVYGDQRGAALADYDGDGRVDLVVSQNAGPTKLYRNERAKRGLRVRLVGPPSNPHAVGATIRLVYGERRGPAREVQAGSGYWSHDGPVKVLGMAQQPTAVWVRWPGGRESETPVVPGAMEVIVRMP